jgi:hypothetical protein
MGAERKFRNPVVFWIGYEPKVIAVEAARKLVFISTVDARRAVRGPTAFSEKTLVEREKEAAPKELRA